MDEDEGQSELVAPVPQGDAVDGSGVDLRHLCHIILGRTACELGCGCHSVGDRAADDYVDADGAVTTKTSARMIVGCLIGFTGVVLVVLPGVSLGAGSLFMWGCIAVLVGEVCYSAGALYSKKVIHQFKEASPVAINAVQMMYGGLLLSLLSVGTESWNMSALDWVPAVSSVIYLTVIGSMVGHSLFYWIMSRTNPLFPATWLYISPPIAVGLGAVVYGEHVSWVTWIGVVLVVSGLLAMNEKVSGWLKKRSRARMTVQASESVLK